VVERRCSMLSKPNLLYKNAAAQWEIPLVLQWEKCVLELGAVGFLYMVDRPSHPRPPKRTCTSGNDTL